MDLYFDVLIEIFHIVINKYIVKNMTLTVIIVNFKKIKQICIDIFPYISVTLQYVPKIC